MWLESQPLRMPFDNIIISRPRDYGNQQVSDKLHIAAG